jgi:hypothetical protein
MATLKELTDQELADFTKLQERVRDTYEDPAAVACAIEKLRDLYAELEARATRTRFRIVPT